MAKREREIRLDPKHGVNPSLMLCLFCGEPAGVALLGYQGGREAPRQGVFDREPCTKCREYMAQGIIVISVDPVKTTDPQNPWRTGGWVVVREEVMRRILTPEAFGRVQEWRACFLEDEVWDRIGFPRLGKEES